MLTIKNVKKEYNGVFALNGINLELNTGLNFILGPSGSGKSTLLKIISGMNQDFQGDVLYKGKSIKEFSKSDLENYYYNEIGFIWQGFNIIDHLTVEENIKLVLDLCNMSEEEKNKKVANAINKLSLTGVAQKKARELSGGQKQRVAIASALIKDPEIIIADEPTGALDKKSSEVIMNIFRNIAKEKTVIIVTHDKSLVNHDSKCYIMKKGEIEEAPQNKNILSRDKKGKSIDKSHPKLSIGNALNQSIRNFKGMLLKFILTSIILVFTSYFLILGFGGSIKNEQDKIFNELIESKGNSLLDISLVSEFMSATGATGEEGKKQDSTVTQDVSEFMGKYEKDERVEYIYILDSVSEMNISINGVAENYKVENSNNVPVVEKLVEGRMPFKEGKEVAVTKKFVENLGLNPKDIIGEEISIKGKMFDRTIEEYVDVEVDNLTIVGVTDSSFSTEFQGQKYTHELEDSFVFGMDVCKTLREQSNKSTSNMSFAMRGKDLKSVLDIVDELNAEGMVPIGQFESIKDIVNLDSTTAEQSNSLTQIIGILSIVVTLCITFINGYLRKREYAILKVNGFSKGSILNLTLMENLMISMVSSFMFIVAYPVISKLSSNMFSMGSGNIESIILGIVVIFLQGIVTSILISTYADKINVLKNLNTGDK